MGEKSCLEEKVGMKGGIEVGEEEKKRKRREK